MTARCERADLRCLTVSAAREVLGRDPGAEQRRRPRDALGLGAPARDGGGTPSCGRDPRDPGQQRPLPLADERGEQRPDEAGGDEHGERERVFGAEQRAEARQVTVADEMLRVLLEQERERDHPDEPHEESQVAPKRRSVASGQWWLRSRAGGEAPQPQEPGAANGEAGGGGEGRGKREVPVARGPKRIRQAAARPELHGVDEVVRHDQGDRRDDPERDPAAEAAFAGSAHRSEDTRSRLEPPPAPGRPAPQVRERGRASPQR